MNNLAVLALRLEHWKAKWLAYAADPANHQPTIDDTGEHRRLLGIKRRILGDIPAARFGFPIPEKIEPIVAWIHAQECTPEDKPTFDAIQRQRAKEASDLKKQQARAMADIAKQQAKEREQAARELAKGQARIERDARRESRNRDQKLSSIDSQIMYHETMLTALRLQRAKLIP